MSKAKQDSKESIELNPNTRKKALINDAFNTYKTALATHAPENDAAMMEVMQLRVEVLDKFKDDEGVSK